MTAGLEFRIWRGLCLVDAVVLGPASDVAEAAERQGAIARRIVEEPELCRWCADFLTNRGQLPSRAQVDAHHKGQRVRRSA